MARVPVLNQVPNDRVHFRHDTPVRPFQHFLPAVGAARVDTEPGAEARLAVGVTAREADGLVEDLLAHDAEEFAIHRPICRYLFLLCCGCFVCLSFALRPPTPRRHPRSSLRPCGSGTRRLLLREREMRRGREMQWQVHLQTRPARKSRAARTGRVRLRGRALAENPAKPARRRRGEEAVLCVIEFSRKTGVWPGFARLCCARGPRHRGAARPLERRA
mmetsp:Transcript_42518/g.104711  ORF Transcript_42518/g.104711 Transcript_42518/m.104711 type:complete len:218 (-) Transcript_42518:466-1119(-)